MCIYIDLCRKRSLKGAKTDAKERTAQFQIGSKVNGTKLLILDNQNYRKRAPLQNKYFTIQQNKASGEKVNRSLFCSTNLVTQKVSLHCFLPGPSLR